MILQSLCNLNYESFFIPLCFQYSDTIDDDPVITITPRRSSTVFCAASKASAKVSVAFAFIFKLLISFVTFSTFQELCPLCPGRGSAGQTITWPEVFLKK